MKRGDEVSWSTGNGGGSGVVLGNSSPVRVLVRVASFIQWLGDLDGMFHPVIDCAETWLKVTKESVDAETDYRAPPAVDVAPVPTPSPEVIVTPAPEVTPA